MTSPPQILLCTNKAPMFPLATSGGSSTWDSGCHVPGPGDETSLLHFGNSGVALHCSPKLKGAKTASNSIPQPGTQTVHPTYCDTPGAEKALGPSPKYSFGPRDVDERSLEESLSPGSGCCKGMFRDLFLRVQTGSLNPPVCSKA